MAAVHDPSEPSKNPFIKPTLTKSSGLCSTLRTLMYSASAGTSLSVTPEYTLVASLPSLCIDKKKSTSSMLLSSNEHIVWTDVTPCSSSTPDAAARYRSRSSRVLRGTSSFTSSIALSRSTPVAVPSTSRTISPFSGFGVSLSMPAARIAAVLTTAEWASQRTSNTGWSGAAASNHSARGHSWPKSKWFQSEPRIHFPSGVLAAAHATFAMNSSLDLTPRSDRREIRRPASSRCTCVSHSPGTTRPIPPQSTTRVVAVMCERTCSVVPMASTLLPLMAKACWSVHPGVPDQTEVLINAMEAICRCLE
eukprot:PhM_4_TR4246/c0_g1_i1/m.10017